MAELGLGILIIPQKPWEMVAEELAEYRRIYRDVNDAEAPAPISSGWVFCDESPDRAEELARLDVGVVASDVVKRLPKRGTLAVCVAHRAYRLQPEDLTGIVADRFDQRGL